MISLNPPSRDATASSASRPALMTSGPMPSAGMDAIRYWRICVSPVLSRTYRARRLLATASTRRETDEVARMGNSPNRFSPAYFSSLGNERMDHSAQPQRDTDPFIAPPADAQSAF